MTCHQAIDVMGEEVEGCLPPALRAGFDAHMAECSPCATYLAHLRLAREAVRHLPVGATSDDRRTQLIAEFKREFGHDADVRRRARRTASGPRRPRSGKR
jgi:anti-sigma factor RsiW